MTLRILFVLMCVTNLSVMAQNLISNSDFTECKSTVISCTKGEGAFDKLKHWGSFGSGPHFGGGGSTPDWFVDNAIGKNVAGIFENEGIYYDIGAGGFETSIYHLSFRALGGAENGDAGGNPVHGVSVYLSTVPPSELNCTNFAGGTVMLLYRQGFTGGSYQNIQFDFPVYNAVVPYRYLVFCTYRDGTCDRYMYIAEPVLTEACCIDGMKYQHCDYLPKYTSRESYIEAGYDVDCIWQPVGDVVVKSNQDVTFQSGGLCFTRTRLYHRTRSYIYGKN